MPFFFFEPIIMHLAREYLQKSPLFFFIYQLSSIGVIIRNVKHKNMTNNEEKMVFQSDQ